MPDITTMALGATPKRRSDAPAAPGVATQEAYPIEHGIPIPPSRSAMGQSVYPVDRMAVGDSFMIRGPVSTVGKRASAAVSGANRRLAPKRFSARRIEGGVRVWRVE